MRGGKWVRALPGGSPARAEKKWEKMKFGIPSGAGLCYIIGMNPE